MFKELLQNNDSNIRLDQLIIAETEIKFKYIGDDLVEDLK
jgi:hypothetical protein